MYISIFKTSFSAWFKEQFEPINLLTSVLVELLRLELAAMKAVETRLSEGEIQHNSLEQHSLTYDSDEYCLQQKRG